MDSLQVLRELLVGVIRRGLGARKCPTGMVMFASKSWQEPFVLLSTQRPHRCVFCLFFVCVFLLFLGGESYRHRISKRYSVGPLEGGPQTVVYKAQLIGYLFLALPPPENEVRAKHQRDNKERRERTPSHFHKILPKSHLPDP